MRRLVAANLLPERAGQPVRAWVHIPLAELLAMEGSTALMRGWVAAARAAWAAHRAGASAGGSDGAAWLDGDAARVVVCDAAMTPIVTGEPNPGALEALVRLCVQLGRLRCHGRPSTGGTSESSTGDDTGTEPGGQAASAADTIDAREALEQAIIGKAAELLSGPGGLASFLPRRQLGARLAGPSLPLDVGVSSDIPG
jgi:hypothetical protein